MATLPVKYYHSGMEGAPQVGNNWGDLTAMLDACLVNGFQIKTINTLTASNGVATANITAGHKYAIDQVIVISGANEADFQGEFRVVTVTTNSFTFSVPSSAPATATGTMTCKVAALNFEIAFTGTNKRAYRSTNVKSPKNMLLIDDGVKVMNPSVAGAQAYTTTWAKWANVGIVQSMSDIGTITGAQAPFNAARPEFNWRQYEAGQFGWYKWYFARKGYDWARVENAVSWPPLNFNRPWFIVGDDRMFYLHIASDSTNLDQAVQYAFGDIESFVAGDLYGTFLHAQDRASEPTSGVTWASSGGPTLGYTRVTEGKLLLRGVSGIGDPVAAGATSLNVSNSQNISGYENYIPYPNPADFGLWLTPCYVVQSDNCMRGTFPGLMYVHHRTPMSNLSVIGNVQGAAGKKFILANCSQVSTTDNGRTAQLAYDITGPWRA